jgi:tetratricopeptide (TPR) repeat protein
LNKARKQLHKAEELYESKISRVMGAHEKTQIYLERLELCEGSSPNPSKLKDITEKSNELHALGAVGVGYTNLALVELSTGKPEEALAAAESALEALNPTETWHIIEIYHLLARCHLALGDLENAQNEIEKAKAGFRDLGLSHRVFQAESTELYIQEARETGNWEQWQSLSLDELRYDFNHLGI